MSHSTSFLLFDNDGDRNDHELFSYGVAEELEPMEVSALRVETDKESLLIHKNPNSSD